MTRSAWMPEPDPVRYPDDELVLGGISDMPLDREELDREAERLKARRPAGFHPNPRTTDMKLPRMFRRTVPELDPTRWHVRPTEDGRGWRIHPPAALHPWPIALRVLVNGERPGWVNRPAVQVECLDVAQRWARHPDEFRAYLALQEFPGRVRS